VQNVKVLLTDSLDGAIVEGGAGFEWLVADLPPTGTHPIQKYAGVGVQRLSPDCAPDTEFKITVRYAYLMEPGFDPDNHVEIIVDNIKVKAYYTVSD
jgi:hypothetical protein